MSIALNYLKPVADLIEKFAPTLASAIFGPAGGIVVNLIESTFGIKPTDNPLDTIQSDSSYQLKLQRLESTHSEAIQKIINHLELAKQDVIDSNSARSREIELAKAGHPNKVMNFIAYVSTVAYFSYLTAIMLKLVPNDPIISSQIFSAQTGIIAYYFAKAHK